MGAVMIAPILPKIAADLVPGHPEAAGLVPLVATAPALAIALCAPFAGWLADRVGRKLLLILGTLVYGIAGAAPALLGALGPILFARIAFGLAEACVMTCCTTLIGDYWHGDLRVRYINRQVVTIGLVGSLFFVVGGAVGEHSWRRPFLLYLLPLLLLPSMATLLWEPLRARTTDSRDSSTAPSTEEGSMASILTIGYLLVSFGMICTFVVPVQTPQLMVGLGEHSSTVIGFAEGCGLLATLAGSATWSWLLKRVGRRLVNGVLLSLMAAGLYLLSRANSVEAVFPAVILHGIGAGLLVPNAMLPMMRRLPLASRGRGLGGFTSALYFGQFVSPLVVLGFVQRFGGLRPAIVAIAACSVMVALGWGVAAVLRGSEVA
ncbi:MAG: MFS transporter [Betaproteobacteria bacterium]|nr:MFS transporter [Betaproteobacteria bacterium]